VGVAFMASVSPATVRTASFFFELLRVLGSITFPIVLVEFFSTCLAVVLPVFLLVFSVLLRPSTGVENVS
jgi:hypothetical protein